MYLVRRYHKDNCVGFRRTAETYGALSNMAPSFSIKIDSTLVRTSEALFQALRFPDYPEIQNKVITQISPITAKLQSRRYINYTRGDWLNCRFKIMKFCIEVKLFQNWNKFYNVLLSTKCLPIVEISPPGTVWGASLNGDYYEGVNALGRLLMQLREDYVINKKPPELIIPEIDKFKFLGREIVHSSISFNIGKI